MQDKKHKILSNSNRKLSIPIEEIINQFKVKIPKKPTKKVKEKEPTNIDYIKMEDYKIISLAKNKIPLSKPDFVIGTDIDGNFLNINNEVVPNPYMPIDKICIIYYSEETNNFIELADKL